MNEPDPPVVNVEEIGGVSRRIVALIGLVAAALLIAVVKPWGAPTPAPSAPTETRPAVADAPTTAAASPAAPDPLADARRRVLCGDETQWRLVTMESGSLGTTRTLYSEAPATAAGPDDGAIPTVDVSARNLLGIGVCRPGPDAGPIPVSGVTIWAVPTPSSASVVTGVITIDPDLSRLGEAYFEPRASATSDGASPGATPGASPDANPGVAWTPGRYVLEIADAAPGGAALWLGLDFNKIQAAAGAATLVIQ